jgi:ABC-type phosphate transport system auxiliary subunit
MPYKSQIKNLQETYQNLDNEVFSLMKNQNKDQVKLQDLIGKRSKTQLEIRKLQKLQWEEEHDRVNFEDDR